MKITKEQRIIGKAQSNILKELHNLKNIFSEQNGYEPCYSYAYMLHAVTFPLAVYANENLKGTMLEELPKNLSYETKRFRKVIASSEVDNKEFYFKCLHNKHLEEENGRDTKKNKK